MKAHRKRDFIVFLIGLAILVLCPLFVGEMYLYLIRIISIYAILTIGLNIFMGYCGQINLGVAGFFCLGAYLPTVLQAKLGWHYLEAFPVTIVVALLLAWAISWPLMRLRSHTMAIGTLSFAMALYLVAVRARPLTGGSDGTVVPSMMLFGKTMGPLFYYYLILFFLAAALAMEYLLVYSRTGRAFAALRDNEEAAEAMGVDIEHYRRLGWLVNGVLASIGGALYAEQAAFISPDTFSAACSFLVLTMFCVGGAGTIVGPLVGAAIMTLLPYLLITIQQYSYLAQGLILFTVLRFLPAGVVGSLLKVMPSRRTQGLPSRAAGPMLGAMPANKGQG